MRAQLLHLSGPARGRTVTYEMPLVTVGSDPWNTAWLSAKAVAPRHARIEWVQEECAFYLLAVDGQIFVNGDEVREVILRDEDQIEFGVGGPRVRFRVYAPKGAVCKPVRKMLEDAKAVAGASGRAAGTTSLTRDLLRHSSWKLRLSVLVGGVGIVLGAFIAGWFGTWLGNRPLLEELSQTADKVTRADLDVLRGSLGEHEMRLDSLSVASESIQRIHSEWSRGVCLVHGVYRLRGPDGEWFMLDGFQPMEPEYTGSGFLASAQGHVITNRHVVVPWEHVELLKPLLEAGYVPEFARLTLTFPGRESIEVPTDSIRTEPGGLDIAVVRVAPVAVKDVPVLPLEPTPAAGKPSQLNERAIVVGYPTGLSSLLARAADDALVAELQRRQATMRQVIDALAAVGKVKPLITQGGISGVEERMIVYDAATTHGGSGGPVFGELGRVIAVNYAIQEGFHGSSFGVPIRFARELLPK